MSKYVTEQLRQQVAVVCNAADPEKLRDYILALRYTILQNYYLTAEPEKSEVGKAVTYLKNIYTELLECCGGDPTPIAVFPSFYRQTDASGLGLETQEFTVSGVNMSDLEMRIFSDYDVFPVDVTDVEGFFNFNTGDFFRFSDSQTYSPTQTLLAQPYDIDVTQASNGEFSFMVTPNADYGNTVRLRRVWFEIGGEEYELIPLTYDNTSQPPCGTPNGSTTANPGFPNEQAFTTEIAAPNVGFGAPSFESDIQYSPLTTFVNSTTQSVGTIQEAEFFPEFLTHKFFPAQNATYSDIDTYWGQAIRHNFDPNVCNAVSSISLLRDFFSSNFNAPANYAVGLARTDNGFSLNNKLLVGVSFEDDIVSSYRVGSQIFDVSDQNIEVPRTVNGFDIERYSVLFYNNVQDGTIFLNCVYEDGSDPAMFTWVSFFSITLTIDTSTFNDVAMTLYADSFEHLDKIRNSLSPTSFQLDYV